MQNVYGFDGSRRGGWEWEEDGGDIPGRRKGKVRE